MEAAASTVFALQTIVGWDTVTVVVSVLPEGKVLKIREGEVLFVKSLKCAFESIQRFSERKK